MLRVCAGLYAIIKNRMKKLLGKVFKEFVYGGHLLSLGASGIVLTAILVSEQNVVAGWPILLLAYLVSQLVYNYDHLDEINDPDANAERSEHLKELKKYYTFTLVVYLFLFAFASLYTSIGSVLIAATIVFGGFIYTKKAKSITKHIVGFKNIYISFFWALLIFLPPSHYHLSPFNSVIWIMTIYIFLRLLVNTVFFDIKDIKEDGIKGLKTLPVVFGIEKTIDFLRLANIISGLGVVFFVIKGTIPVFSLTLLLFVLYSLYYLRKSLAKDKGWVRMASYLIVDGEYFLTPIILLVGRTTF